MKAKCIMIQGTASSVGKSIITAGLCRIFAQDGYKVAPFKSQNMALNSYITGDGKEIGRAQAVQAEAAGVEPSVEMNPILLKPTTDKKSQVIINGKVYKNMSAAEYHDFKPELAAMIRETYEGLAAGNDIIVIEGAGSPAEINLRDKDIVNMGMAEIADAPVLLVGDIDKGGVFASLAGTVMLLEESERQRIKGAVINKFRGDLEILKPGLRMIEDIIQIPVVGVLPYANLEIDDEDSLAERFTRKKAEVHDIDVAVIKLPHMSNFTDLNALENTPGVGVRYADCVGGLGTPDMIVVPGSKNTIGDLGYIRKSGLEAAIKNLHAAGTLVFGICGGYQMLGGEISDPHQTESGLLRMDGMGLLNTRTVFRRNKRTTQAEAVVSDGEGMLTGLENTAIRGYEIHMGETEYGSGCIPFLRFTAKERENRAAAGYTADVAGVRNEAGNVYGTYIHGIFDNLPFTYGLIRNLRKAKGLPEREPEGPAPDFARFKEQQYDALADMLRQNLDMEAIYGTMGLKPGKRKDSEHDDFII